MQGATPVLLACWVFRSVAFRQSHLKEDHTDSRERLSERWSPQGHFKNSDASKVLASHLLATHPVIGSRSTSRHILQAPSVPMRTVAPINNFAHRSSRIMRLDAQDFQAAIEDARQRNKVMVVKFIMSRCPTCRNFAPKFQRIAENLPENFECYEFFADRDAADFCRALGVTNVPRVQVFDAKKGNVDDFEYAPGWDNDLAVRLWDMKVEFERMQS